MTLFGLYIVICFCIYIIMFIICVIIILICSWCCCCCCRCWNFCCCIIVTICCCSPNIGLWLMAGSKEKFVFQKGEIDVATPGVSFDTFGANKGSWSFLKQHSSPWLLLLLHVFVRKYLHTILLRCSRFLWFISSFCL